MTAVEMSPATAAAPAAAISAEGLVKHYPLPQSIGDRLRGNGQAVKAVDGVDLSVAAGEAIGVVGESGCGKSTLAKLLTGVDEPTAGVVKFGNSTLSEMSRLERARAVQLVFQDPYSSLNPRVRVGDALTEVLRVHGAKSGAEAEKRARELLSLVGLDERHYGAHPSRLSGGQRQRVSIARALAVEPSVLVADEPTSALDVSIQASVLNLLMQLRDRLSLTLVFISHDITVVQHLCSRVMVMYLGRVVDVGPTEEVLQRPKHPYTRSLVAAVPRIDGGQAGAPVKLTGDPPSPINIPSGCRFHPRCPMATDICKQVDPELVEHGNLAHKSACHHAEEV